MTEKQKMLHLPFLFLLLALASRLGAQTPAQVSIRLTHPAGTARWERQPDVSLSGSAPSTGNHERIDIDPRTRFQPMDGFGFTLTGGSAQLLRRMSPPARSQLLRELFATDDTNIGVSFLRISVGASDLNDRVFTYNDLPKGETDPEMKRFSLDPDRTDLLPVLQEILRIQPTLKIMASPWSAPSWMKTEFDSKGGSLEREWFGAYARYLTTYVRAMEKEGIPLHSLTIQNEPLNADNNPSMYMSAADQTVFIRDHLGQAFQSAGITTRIICYDHNADQPDYPLTVLADPQAKAFVEGSAFHLYAGQIEAIEQVHTAHPDRSLYFTEQWTGAPGNFAGDLSWHIQHILVGATRHWCRAVLEWNLAADPQNRPHTDRGGCERCLGALTLDGDKVVRNTAWYVIAHASREVRPGSVRIASTASKTVPNVAFQTPDGRHVLIVLNPGKSPRAIHVGTGSHSFTTTLPAGSVATCTWPGKQ